MNEPVQVDWKPVHRGAAHGIWINGVPLDDCNAYCTDEVHCSLIYAIPKKDSSTIEGLQKQIAAHFGYPVVRIIPAKEAPPITKEKAAWMMQVGEAELERAEAFLMFWRPK